MQPIEVSGGLAVLPGSHKVEFFRPPDLFGNFGMGARKRSREHGQTDANMPNGAGDEWPLPAEYRRMGMTPITMQPGDILVMPGESALSINSLLLVRASEHC